MPLGRRARYREDEHAAGRSTSSENKIDRFFYTLDVSPLDKLLRGLLDI
jgi:hypothetical protein